MWLLATTIFVVGVVECMAVAALTREVGGRISEALTAMGGGGAYSDGNNCSNGGSGEEDGSGNDGLTMV